MLNKEPSPKPTLIDHWADLTPRERRRALLVGGTAVAVAVTAGSVGVANLTANHKETTVRDLNVSAVADGGTANEISIAINKALDVTDDVSPISYAEVVDAMPKVKAGDLIDVKVDKDDSNHYSIHISDISDESGGLANTN
jgi:TusA-related sulfurtransferase